MVSKENVQVAVGMIARVHMLQGLTTKISYLKSAALKPATMIAQRIHTVFCLKIAQFLKAIGMTAKEKLLPK